MMQHLSCEAGGKLADARLGSGAGSAIRLSTSVIV